MSVPERLSAGELRRRLLAGGEVALIDVREKRPYGKGHILLAANAPLRGFAGELQRLVPGRSVDLLLCDDGSGLAAAAAKEAESLGYDRPGILEGGIAAWVDAGGTLFDGENVLGTALAEVVDAAIPISKLTADDLVAMRERGADPVVLDSRPWESYRRAHIPGATSCPGGELVYRAAELAPDPETPIVVNCAGRSRSIYGARSLIDAGVSNPIFSLHNGTVGWWRSGRDLAIGDGPRADRLTRGSPEVSLPAARRLAKVWGVLEIDRETLELWIGEAGRHTLHCLDVRLPEAYASAHVAGSLSAPGGQLVECSDDWIGLRGGRVVLFDDDGVRSRLTASWLRRLGYETVAVMAPGEAPEQDAAGQPGSLSTLAASDDPDAVYYPDYATLEDELLASEHHVVGQVALPGLIVRDGLANFSELSSQAHP